MHSTKYKIHKKKTKKNEIQDTKPKAINRSKIQAKNQKQKQQ